MPEFRSVRDVYEEQVAPDGSVDVVLLQENVKTRWFCRDLAEITGVEEVYNENGNARRKYCKVYTNTMGEKVLYHTYNEIKGILQQTKIGY